MASIQNSVRKKVEHVVGRESVSCSSSIAQLIWITDI